MPENEALPAKQLSIGVNVYATGNHVAAWRHPAGQADAGLNLDHYIELARLAERGKLDMLFLGDNSAVRGLHDIESLSRQSANSAVFEPITLLSALAAVTSKVGLVATSTTTYNEPYHTARRFASLDHLSKGRSGWNIVTSNNPSEAYNFGLDAHPAHDDRYERAEEFVTVVKGLWDSWEQGAFVRDPATGLFFDPAKLHVLGHEGKHFKVRGPLNVARVPQGRPVLVQAGASEIGREFAARHAEVIFTAQATRAEGQAFYADMKRRIAAHGRDPNSVKIMPGFSAIVGRTNAEAQQKFKALQALVDPVVGVALLSVLVGNFDLSGYPLDGPLPEMPVTNGPQGRQRLLIDKARHEGLTIRQLYEYVAQARGHCSMVGTPAQVADEMQAWFVDGAADGFNLLPPILPEGLRDFVDMVVPELQNRGIFRRDYSGSTLRDHLGIPEPVHEYQS